MSGLPWFRMYVDFLEDPKILSLAFEDQRHFVGILALKSAGVTDQNCDPVIMNKIVAQKLWVDHSAIVEVKRRLVEAELIDSDWQPLAWEKRQRRSDHDPSGAERQRRYRDKSKGSNTDHNALRNGDSNADRNGAVTLPDKIREEEKKNKNTTASKKAETDYPHEFEQVWKAYPSRQGDNPKGRALKAWSARIKEGHTAEEMQKGVEQYAEFVRTGGKEGTEYVKQAATFFGPDKPFLNSWKSEGGKEKKKEEQQPWFMRGI